jgi:hypothetical protein
MGIAEPRNLASALRLNVLNEKVLWRINRLRTMTPAEIRHRVVQAAHVRAERWGFARCVVPPADLARRASPWIDRQARVDREVYCAAAERVVAGRFDVFALRDVELGNPPQWNRDPKTGIEAPMDFGMELDYRDAARVGDIKYLWEPNRHLHLVTLAQAHALTGDPRFAHTLRKHLESWFATCPFRMGANWASALEAGLRLVNWSFAWQLLGGAQSPLFHGPEGERFRNRWLESVFQHAEFVASHFSQHSSANNHLVGEAAGLFIAGVAWPHWERARDWRETGQAILEREALMQNAPDGVNREQAFSYHQWTFDLLLLPLLAARANGFDFSRGYVERLERMLDFLASVMDGAGNVPMVGDADDGFVVRLDPRASFCRYRSLLATGAILFRRGEFKAKARTLDDKTRWLLGAQAGDVFECIQARRHDLPVRRDFPEGGYYILGKDFETKEEVRLVADAGPLGYQAIAAHGHADALSFVLSVGGLEFIVDPGTFAYHTEPAWRAYFRGTSAHNTVRIDGEDQSVPGGNFMWLEKANAACVGWRTSAEEDFFEGWHDGYLRLDDPVVHRRTIRFLKRERRVVVEDMLQMEGSHGVELFFHWSERCALAPGEGGFVATQGGRTLRLHLPEIAGARSELLVGSMAPRGGWISRRFDVREPSPTVRWSATLAGECVLRSVIELGD